MDFDEDLNSHPTKLNPRNIRVSSTAISNKNHRTNEKMPTNSRTFFFLSLLGGLVCSTNLNNDEEEKSETCSGTSNPFLLPDLSL